MQRIPTLLYFSTQANRLVIYKKTNISNCSLGMYGKLGRNHEAEYFT